VDSISPHPEKLKRKTTIILFIIVCRNAYRVLVRNPGGKRALVTSEAGLGSMELVRIAVILN
jgi:hypothetical protein